MRGADREVEKKSEQSGSSVLSKLESTFKKKNLRIFYLDEEFDFGSFCQKTDVSVFPQRGLKQTHNVPFGF